MGTLKKRIENPEEIVESERRESSYGPATAAPSTSPGLPIPYVREADRTAHRCLTRFKHIGLYVYRRDFLLSYSDLPVGPLEQAERLEQLRALENGYPIRVAETEYESLGVDTPEDFERVSKLFEASLFSIHG